jgi:hypothetical protein
VGLERDSRNPVSTTEELLVRKSSGFGLETENTVVGTRHADHMAPLSAKVGTNLSDKRILCSPRSALCPYAAYSF